MYHYALTCLEDCTSKERNVNCEDPQPDPLSPPAQQQAQAQPPPNPDLLPPSSTPQPPPIPEQQHPQSPPQQQHPQSPEPQHPQSPPQQQHPQSPPQQSPGQVEEDAQAQAGPASRRTRGAAQSNQDPASRGTRSAAQSNLSSSRPMTRGAVQAQRRVTRSAALAKAKADAEAKTLMSSSPSKRIKKRKNKESIRRTQAIPERPEEQRGPRLEERHEEQRGPRLEERHEEQRNSDLIENFEHNESSSQQRQPQRSEESNPQFEDIEIERASERNSEPRIEDVDRNERQFGSERQPNSAADFATERERQLNAESRELTWIQDEDGNQYPSKGYFLKKGLHTNRCDIRFMKAMPFWREKFEKVDIAEYTVNATRMKEIEHHCFGGKADKDADWWASLKPGVGLVIEAVDRYASHLENRDGCSFCFFLTNFCSTGQALLKKEDEGLFVAKTDDWVKFYAEYSFKAGSNRAGKDFHENTHLFFPMYISGRYILFIFNIENWELWCLDPGMEDEELCREAAFFVITAAKQILYIRDPPKVKENVPVMIYMLDNIPKDGDSCNSGVLICLYMLAYSNCYDLREMIEWSAEDSKNFRFKIVDLLKI